VARSGAEDRDGQLVQLRFVGPPQRLDVRGRAELPEPGNIVGVDNLEVGEVVAMRAVAVRRLGCLDGVEGFAHRAVAEGGELWWTPPGAVSEGWVDERLGGEPSNVDPVTHPNMAALAPQLIADADIETFETAITLFIEALSARLERPTARR
jgi:hypothetical protein